MIQFKNKHLTVFESALYRTTSAVIETPDFILVVDPNWLPQEVIGIQHYVETIRHNRAVFLLCTHSDYDHIIGYRAFPNAKVIASKAFVQNTDKQAIIKQIQKFDDEYYIKRSYKIEYPVVDFVIEKEGQLLKFGNTEMVFYQAAGHNSDGIFTILPVQKIWIAGDYFCNVEFPYIYHSSIEYEETLAKTEPILAQFDIELLIPGHGDILTNHAQILQLKKTALAYIRNLRNSLKNGKTFDLDNFLKNYDFPQIMTKFHQGNVTLMKNELKS